MRLSALITALVSVIVLGQISLVAASPTQSSASGNTITPYWAEQVEPLDIAQFMQNLPYGQQKNIDELTLRRLFADLLQRAENRMQIKGNGGDFEKTLKRYVLYFNPEVEYYWPPYAQDASKKVVKFPITVKKIKAIDDPDVDVLEIH